jgi:dihydroorotate dehydrogenase electron transfer subunit
MNIGEGQLLELYYETNKAAARIACDSTLIPAPGQYLLAHDPASDNPLAIPVFPAGTAPEGFLVASPLPRDWNPGLTLSLRGPLGHGFILPASARRVALISLDESPAPLLALLAPAFAQGASVALVCPSPPDDLPADVEVQPPAALQEVSAWADYLALLVARESLPGLRARLGRLDQHQARSERSRRLTREAQALVSAPVPCGGLAECGVCAVNVKNTFRLACKDGPVFPLFDLLA